MHLMNYKGLSWIGMKVNEDLTEESHKSCWRELVSCAQIFMPREGEGPAWKVLIDNTTLEQSPALKRLLSPRVGGLPNPLCSKALEYLDYETKCAREANEEHAFRLIATTIENAMAAYATTIEEDEYALAHGGGVSGMFTCGRRGNGRSETCDGGPRVEGTAEDSLDPHRRAQ